MIPKNPASTCFIRFLLPGPEAASVAAQTSTTSANRSAATTIPYRAESPDCWGALGSERWVTSGKGIMRRFPPTVFDARACRSLPRTASISSTAARHLLCGGKRACAKSAACGGATAVDRCQVVPLARCLERPTAGDAKCRRAARARITDQTDDGVLDVPCPQGQGAHPLANGDGIGKSVARRGLAHVYRAEENRERRRALARRDRAVGQ